MTELNILNFPSVVIYKILSYFTPQELCLYIAPLCHRWYELAHDPVLWQHLTFNFNQVLKLDELESVLQKAPKLKSICLHRKTDLTFEEVQLISLCPMLEHLDIGFCTNVNSRMFSQLLKTCPNMISLNVEGCVDIDIRCIKVIIKWSTLHKLNLSHCTRLTDDCIMDIAASMNKLKFLNIDGIAWITDSAIVHLAELHCNWLQHLILDGAQLTDTSFKALSLCQNLKELKISFAELISDEALDYIQNLHQLEYLSVKHAGKLSAFKFNTLFTGATLRHLKSLNLSDCTNLDDSVIKNICECCTKLKSLAVEWCWNISDIGLEYIVSRCRYLEYLDLLGIYNITGLCLRKIPTCLPKLSYLDLRECNLIDDDVISEVVKQKPDLHVLNYYGEKVT